MRFGLPASNRPSQLDAGNEKPLSVYLYLYLIRSICLLSTLPCRDIDRDSPCYNTSSIPTVQHHLVLPAIWSQGVEVFEHTLFVVGGSVYHGYSRNLCVVIHMKGDTSNPNEMQGCAVLYNHVMIGRLRYRLADYRFVGKCLALECVLVGSSSYIL